MPVSYSPNTEELETSLGYHFKDKSLLFEALTHKSYHHETPEGSILHNERLEFLGDSVIGLVIAETLFLDRGLLTEADMSKMRSYLVNRSILGDIALLLSLGKYLRLGKGEESTGGRQKQSVLADALEALCGAAFLDSNYETSRTLVRSLFRERIGKVVAKGEGRDSKSELQEACQGVFGVLPEYRIVRQEGEEHRKIFTAEVYIEGVLRGKGTGKSKKEAQTVAAGEALKTLAQRDE